MKKITLLLLMCFSSFLSFAQVALTEGFEGTTLPNLGTDTWQLGSGNWAVFDNGVGTINSWNVNTGTGTPPLVYEGTRAAFMNAAQDNIGAGGSSQDWLVSPAVTVPTNGQLRFYTRQSVQNDQGNLYQIRISTTSQTDASSFTVLKQWTEAELNATFNVYEEKVVPLNLPANSTVYIAFVMVVNQTGAATSGDRWLVDKVLVRDQCVDPTNLGTGTVNTTTANLTWTNPGGATSWEIEILPDATTTPSGHGVIYNGASPYASTGTATGSPLVQTPYVSGSAYKYYIRALCGTGTNATTSNWVGPFSFTIAQVGTTCSSAIQVPSLPYSTSGNTSSYGDTIEGTPGTSCGVDFAYLAGNDVFYSYTATETGVISISMTPTATYSGLFVYNGCANVGISCIAGVGNSGTGIRNIPALAVTAGQTYIILISTWAPPQTTAYSLVIQKVNCTPPTTLAAPSVTQTTATLSWANPGNLASSWQVDVQTAGTPIPTGAGTTTTNNTAYPVSGLLPGTSYRFYVRSDCGDGTFSTWSGPFVFTTQCNAFNVPFQEGFNSNSTSQVCWTVLNVNGDADSWNMDYTTTPFEGNQTAVIITDFNAGNNDDWLITPILNLTGNQRLKYHYRVQSATEPDAFEVKLSTTGIAPANFTSTIVPLASYNNITYVEKIVNLNGVTGPVNIGFHVPPGGPDGYRLFIDNVIVEDIPSCPNPTNLTAGNFNTTNAQLSWTAGNIETQWQVVVQAPGTGVPAATAGGTPVGNPYTATTSTAGPLVAGTQYEYYVRAYCAANDQSQWVGPFLFSTAICDLAQQCTYTFAMTDSFGDGWNGNTMSIRQNGITVATIGSTFTTGAGPVNVSVPLCDGVPFELFWNAGGSFPTEVGVSIIDPYDEVLYTKASGQGTQNSLLYSGVVNCAPPTCPKPQNVSVLSVSLENGAVLDWDEAGTATSWELIVQPQGTGAPTGTSIIVNTPPPYTFELDPAIAAYEFYVRALCGPGDVSYWAGPVEFALPPITVNDTQYTIEQLVQQVLIGSECAVVTNVTSSTGTNFGQANGIGYFDQNGSNFPFANGVVLSTGSISQAQGPYPGENTGFETNTWLGDDDLNALIVPGGNTAGVHNASVLEFDFVPLINEISFDFLFASSEYGTFQCSFSDAFAFLLTDANGVTQNLAVIPGTTTPVSVVNIRDAQYNSGCSSANVEYFGQFNENNPEASAIGYGGQTVVMTAQSPVIVGQTYHIKLVIADYSDSNFNSAVFLAGGSFNIGDIDLGADLTVDGGNAVCGGESFTIVSGLDPDDYDFVWTGDDGAVIPGANGPNLTVTETGTYTIAAAFTGSTCSVTASVRIEFYDPIEEITGEPTDLFACDPDGFATFDLSQNTPAVLTGLNPSEYTVSYHLSQADADTNVGALPLTYENVVQFTQPIFVRITDNVTLCSGTKTFDLVVQDLTPQFTITPNFSLCNGTSGTITVTPINFNTADVTYSWTLDGTTPLPDTGSSISVSTAGTYQVTINNTGCSATASTTVTIVPVPVADILPVQFVCDSYILPALSAGNNYFTGANGTGTQLSAGSLVETTQLIYIYAQSGTTPNCTDQSTFTVTVSPTIEATVTGACDGSQYVMEVTPNNSSFDPNTATYAWSLAATPNVILGTNQTYVATESGDYIVQVTTTGDVTCGETFSFTANGTTCQIMKGISPNGDGKNDSFDLTGLQVRKISIFNRYGTIVFDYSNYTDQWHGQSNKGDELPDGTYFYSFERDGGESKTGWIYINRQRN